jgi:hypothetical protein
MYCPECEDKFPEMNSFIQYESDTARMEITFECVNPECPVQFYGIIYRTKKPMQGESPKEKLDPEAQGHEETTH